MATLENLFHGLTGRSVKPWPFQVRTIEALQRNENVLLRAPTGTGKTWASLLGFLYGWISKDVNVDRVIYALPLRSLASGLYNSTKEALRKAINSPSLNESEKERLRELRITIQTGEQREDPFFQGNITFTTIDQLLSSYLNIPVSLPSRLGNINAGSLVGALVILDEIHLLEPAHSLRTLLEIARQMKGLTQFLFMTATLSQSSLDWLTDYLKATLIQISNNEILKMPGQADKERVYHWIETPINVESIISRHNRGRTLIICNTVARAQQLYMELKETDYRPKGSCLILLHSRFFPADRKNKEEQLDYWFGPQAKGDNVILIATQVVEAGLDLSAEVLHTELCPANALLQRAGRSARYEDRNHGDVFVYSLQANKEGRLDYGPYRDLAHLVDLTGQTIQSFDGKMIDMDREKELINLVHTDNEQKAFSDMKANRRLTRDLVLKTIRDGDRAQMPVLVREIDSVSVFIHDQPEQLDILGGMEFLSVPSTSLFRIKEHFERVKALNTGKWVAKMPAFPGDEERGQIIWQEVTSVKQARNSWLLVIHPRFAAYDQEIGLQWNVEGQPVQPEYHPKSRLEHLGYSLETYREHIEKTLKALQNRDREVENGRMKMSEKFGLEQGVFEELEKIVCIIHDAGKLRELYQNGSINWEKDRYPDNLKAIGGEPLAHTTFAPASDWLINKQKRYYRGNHAAEGAYAVCEELAYYLIGTLGEEKGAVLTRLLVSVISRHHSPWTNSVTPGRLVEGSIEVLNSLLADHNLAPFIKKTAPVITESDKVDYADILYDPTRIEHQDWLALYFYLIRCLRIADQESFKIECNFLRLSVINDDLKKGGKIYEYTDYT